MSERNLAAVSPAVHPQPTLAPSKPKTRRKTRLMSSGVVFWIVVLGSAAVLLWGWALAIQSIIAGTTVKLG